jgi:hypothetical protein
MRKPAVVLFLLLCSSFLAYGQKYRLGQSPVSQNPADYTIKVHISATHLRSHCTGSGDLVSCSNGLYVETTLNGKKVELFGAVDKHQSSLIFPGDYSAMLPKRPLDGGREVLGQQYYVLLPDRSAWICTITGFSE